jgi:hypothetical protein
MKTITFTARRDGQDYLTTQELPQNHSETRTSVSRMGIAVAVVLLVLTLAFLATVGVTLIHAMGK